jgi:hypothetical protein
MVNDLNTTTATAALSQFIPTTWQVPVTPAKKKLEGNARLHVFTAYFNHNQSENVRNNFNRFREHMEKLGVTLHVTEVVLNTAPFEVTSPDNQNHTQLRAKYELFRKENVINIAIRRALEHYRDDIQFMAWVDADVQFVNEKIVQDTIDALHRHKVVQMWTRAIDLGPDGVPLNLNSDPSKESCVVKSFAWCHLEYGIENRPKGRGYNDRWHPGYAWAITREAYEEMGGLFDLSVFGSGDTHMAMSFVGRGKESLHGKTSKNYQERSWEHLSRIETVINGDIGCVDGLLMHYWHGRKANRKYVERWSIPIDNNFEPGYDLFRRPDGMFELTDRNPKLRDDIRAYIRQRDEDCNTL